MKVKDLINQLGKLDSNLEVYVLQRGWTDTTA